MKRTIAKVASLALMIGLVWAPSTNASTHVFVQFGSQAPVYAPAPVYVPTVVPVQYRYGYVWQPGYYVRASYGHRRWVPGHWVRAPYARRGWWGRGHGRWERERWEREHSGGAGVESRYRSR